MTAPPSRAGAVGLAILALVLAGLFLGASMVVRTVEESLAPGEGTSWAQAASLAHDLDLAYSRADYDRLVATHGAVPRDLELASGSGGRRIAFDRPFLLGLWNAPFVALSPRHGLYYANATIVTLAAVALFFTLRRRVGSQGVFWTLGLVGGTLLFAQVLRAGPDAALAAFAALAGCLAAASHPSPRDLLADVYAVPGDRALSTRWALVGFLLAIAIAAQPLHLALAVGLWWAVPREAAGSARRGLVVGTLLTLVVIGVVELWVSGGLPLVGTSRFRFTAGTGFPAVDFPATDWEPAVRRLRALHWEGAPRSDWGLDPRLFGWNLVYFLLGREVGLLVTAPAALLLLFAFGARRDRTGRIGRLGPALGAALWVTALLLARPFRFHGDVGSSGNALVLVPLALLWPLVAARVGRSVLVGTVVLTALVLGPVWLAPGAVPPVPGPLASLLPAEVTQKHLGGPVSFLGGFRARVLAGDAWIEERRDRLMVAGRKVELMLGGGEEIGTVLMIAGESAPIGLEIAGAEAGATTLRPDGGFERVLLPAVRQRVHPTWWSPESQRIAVLRLELPAPPTEPLTLRFLPAGSKEQER